MALSSHLRRFIAALACAVVSVGAATPACAASGLLLINVQAAQTDQGVPTRTSFRVSSFTLKNVQSGKSTSFLLVRGHGTQVEEVEEGRYCLESITVGQTRTFEFCHPPQIVVLPGKVSNAGLWQYGVEGNLKTARRLFMGQAKPTVLADAKKIDAEALKRFAAPPSEPVIGLDFVALKPHAELHDRDRLRLRSMYGGIEATDSPPYPRHGLGEMIDTLSPLREADGSLILQMVVTVDSAGKVIESEVTNAMPPAVADEARKIATRMDFVAPVCAKGPCAMQFPINLRLESLNLRFE